jgi:hypothetical protein
MKVYVHSTSGRMEFAFDGAEPWKQKVVDMTADEMLTFIEDAGTCVVEFGNLYWPHDTEKEKMWNVEVYDDYRE